MLHASHEYQRHLSKLHITTCIVTFSIRGFPPVSNLGKRQAFGYPFCILYLQTLNKIILVFQEWHMGPFDAETSFTTYRGLRSKPELTHHSCTEGRYRLVSHSFCHRVCPSSPLHNTLLKPKGFLLLQERANTKTSQIKQIPGHPSNSLRAQHAPLESFLCRHLELSRHT